MLVSGVPQPQTQRPKRPSLFISSWRPVEQLPAGLGRNFHGAASKQIRLRQPRRTANRTDNDRASPSRFSTGALFGQNTLGSGRNQRSAPPAAPVATHQKKVKVNTGN